MNSLDPAITSLLAAKDATLKSQIAFSLAAKSLDAQQQQGDAAVQLIESAAQIGRATNRGQSFDRTA